MTRSRSPVVRRAVSCRWRFDVDAFSGAETPAMDDEFLSVWLGVVRGYRRSRTVVVDEAGSIACESRRAVAESFGPVFAKARRRRSVSFIGHRFEDDAEGYE